MTKKIISQRKRLAAIFVSFSIVIMGSASLFESMSLDYYSVLGTLEKVFPASISLGLLGWMIGLILDTSSRGVRKNYMQLFTKGSANNRIVDLDMENFGDVS
jgi:hypothetical protein